MEPEDHYNHHDTSTKAKVQGAIEFCERMNISYFKNDVFKTFEVSKQQEYQMLQSETFARRRNNDSEHEETRDRKSLISNKDIREMKRVLKSKSFEVRALTWKQLDFEMSLKCSDDTIKRAMRTMNYHKCIVCMKSWVLSRTVTKRIEYAVIMLKRYSEEKNWWSVQFSDEIHFEYESQEKLRIIQKSDQRYCMNCIQKINSSKDKNLKRQHCWAAVDHNFKSNIHFYDVLENINEKLTLKIYLKQILKSIVKLWIENHFRFVLKKNDDSDHETKSKNIVKIWKQENKLKHYFNCTSSSDLSSIENMWQISKQKLRKYSHWNDHTTKKLIYEEWSHVSQKYINEKISTMSERLKVVIEEESRMTDY